MAIACEVHPDQILVDIDLVNRGPPRCPKCHPPVPERGALTPRESALIDRFLGSPTWELANWSPEDLLGLKGAVGLLRNRTTSTHPKVGLIITLEGPDKVGKTTQWHLLAEHLDSLGVPHSLYAFPAYETPIGKEIKAQLAHMTLSPAAFQGLQTVNRAEMAMAIKQDLALGKVVLMNRYLESALVYGVLDDPSAEEHIWRMSSVLPQSDLVIVLDASNWTLDKDFYEEPEKQKRIRDLYREQALKHDWAVVDARSPPPVVHERVWDLVMSVIRERLKA